MARPQLAALGLFAATGCMISQVGSGIPATVQRNAPGAVAFESALFVDSTVYIDSTGPSVALTCDDNLLASIVTEVQDGVLVLRSATGTNLVPRTQCQAIVHLPEVRSLTLTGSGSTVLADAANGVAEGLAELAVTGSGDLHVDVHAAGVEQLRSTGSGDVDVVSLSGCSVAIEHSGSGRVDVGQLHACDLDLHGTGSGHNGLGGTADTASIRLTGSGDIGDERFVAQSATLHSTGSANITLTVTDQVTVTLTGSGDAVVYGDPQVMSSSETGSGRASYP